MKMESAIGLGFFLQNIGFPELAIILGLGVLFFGRKLPDVGRSLGKSIVEFKKGLKGIEEEIDDASNRPEPKRPASGDRLEGDAPKFT
jgi:sec-independent protein translocase protein TatA